MGHLVAIKKIDSVHRNQSTQFQRFISIKNGGATMVEA